MFATLRSFFYMPSNTTIDQQYYLEFTMYLHCITIMSSYNLSIPLLNSNYSKIHSSGIVQTIAVQSCSNHKCLVYILVIVIYRLLNCELIRQSIWSIAVFSLRKTKSAKNLGAKIFLQKKDAKKQKKSDHLKVHFYCKMLCYFSVLSLFPLIFHPR